MTRDCSNSLLHKSRRQRLTAEEQLALGVHLQACDSCRLFQSFLEDLERAGQADAGDARRIAAMVYEARSWARKRSGVQPKAASWLRAFLGSLRHRPRRALLLVGMLLLTGLASAAGWYARDAAPDERQASGPRQQKPATMPDSRRSASAPSTEASAADSAEPTPTAPTAASGSDKRLESRGASKSRALKKARESAASLFQKANAWRRSNQADRAIAGYQKLQAQFPGSPEAQLSELALGRLFLARGSANAALGHFERALAAQAASSVQVEALYGKGLALSALGRQNEERLVWQRLVREFPSSPYVVHAKRRLKN